MDTRTGHSPTAKWDASSRREVELIDEIVATAELVLRARSSGGVPLVRRDPIGLLLRAVERSQYCCAIADVARLLRVSRQRAHQIARSAERIGAVELLTNPDDRRIVQVFLTRAARSELAAARAEERVWAASLLLGLDQHRMSDTTRVLRVIRQRLMRAERDRLP
jgi:DNA-binding MarR family transcriptional regulator